MFVLVQWVETSETSILTEDMVVDKTMLNNPTKVGMVKHGELKKKTPKQGWKAYPAKILAANESKSSLLKLEQEIATDMMIEEDDTYSKESRAVRKRKMSSSDEEDKDEHMELKKKKKEMERKRVQAERKAMSEIFKASSIDDSDDDSSGEMMNMKLKKEVKKLKEQNSFLQEGLVDLIKETISAIEVKCSCRCRQAQPRLPFSSPPASPSLKSEILSAEICSPEAKSVDLSATTSEEELGKYLSPSIITQVMRAKDYGKLTCQLMTCLFDTKEMAVSLVTGKRLKPEDRDREVLDQGKVNAIIACVVGRFSGVSASEVRSKMGQKCKDTRAAQKRMQRGVENNVN